MPLFSNIPWQHFVKHQTSQNTAYYTAHLHEMEAKIELLKSVRHMLQYDAWSFGLPRSSRVRVFLVNLASSKVFQGAIFFLIIINCVVLGVDSPPRHGLERVLLDLIQLPIYGSFIFEMLVLIVGHGFRCYWSSNWNKMDFIVVVGSILDMASYYTIRQGSGMTEEGGAGMSSTEVGSLFILITGLRTLRALRPLRVLRRAKTLRRLGFTIVQSLASLSSAMALFLAFIYVAAVLLLQFLAGRLSQCSDPSIHYQAECTGVDDLSTPRRWSPSIFNADWIGPALLTALAVAGGSGWGSR